MAMAYNDYSTFIPDPSTAEYLTMSDRRKDRTPSPARKLWPFNRSRSSSPNTQGQLNIDTDFSTTRSRKSSANSNSAISPSGSNSSFVVRSVIRNPGGVSMPTSPGNDSNQRFNSNGSRQQSSSPGARRMTLEDSDDDMSQPQQQLQYRRSKSKPLGATTSLGVPPGGPGGGVGYGTARSSNDGRIEPPTAHQQSPFYRPLSPSGSMTAGDFRGRSPRKSQSPNHSHDSAYQNRPGSANSATSASSPSNNGKKPVARITAGPKSMIQQQHEERHQPHFQQQQDQHHHSSPRGPSPNGPPRQPAMSGPRQFPGGPPPPGAGYHPHSPQHHPHHHPHHHPRDPRNHSAGPPPMDQRGGIGFPPMPPYAQESRDDSPSRSRRFSFGIAGRSRKDSEKGHPAPLDGLPSPVDIPYGRTGHSPMRFGGGTDTDYSRQNSPFGSVSPARAPASPNSSGFLKTLMGKSPAAADDQHFEHQQLQQQRSRDDGVPRSCSPNAGSNLAGKWFKGVFGRSPRGDEKEFNYGADLSPYPFANGPSNIRDPADEAAHAQKLASMRQARHIVDQERQQWMQPGPVTPTGARGPERFDPNRDREYKPRQAIDSDAEPNQDNIDDAEMDFELGRKKSPPGRKPVPAYLPAAMQDSDPTPASNEPLTPAQRIIQETRSKQLAREQIEAQRKEAREQQQQQQSSPRKVLAANADFIGPPTPPKNQAQPLPNNGGHQQRFPSGAHQFTREPAAQAGPTTPTPGPAKGLQSGPAQQHQQQRSSTLSPGSGPMPADMPLRDALQEMMTRFYRFERYSVPLIRSLETRLLDIERDAMLANNPQARNSTRASRASSSSGGIDPAEMDRWVNQMTSLMKHEVGQLKAATREIKESRELVAHVARQTSDGGKAVPLSMSVSSFGSLVNPLTPSASQQMPKSAAAGVRQTNVSSSTFDSAVPLVKQVFTPPANNLGLPAGAKPALDKDEGKSTSPTKAIFGFASESAKEHRETGRDRSVSPNGRPRFTSVLGQPLAHGRLSPSPTSPGPSMDATEGHDFKREVSVEDRLKALMEGGATRSRSTSFASNSAALDREEEKEESGNESGSSDIAAALAAIDASTRFEHEKTRSSELTVRHEAVAVEKSASNSSSDTSASSAEEVVMPLTPTVESAPSGHPKDATTSTTASEGEVTLSRLPYLSPTAAGGPTSGLPQVSGRISPTKLFANKFATPTPFVAGSAPSSPGAKLGLVEKKRFTLPSPSTVASSTSVGAGLGVGVTTTVQARAGGRLSRSPSYTVEEGPTSAAFSGANRAKPVGHKATLMERVAFFDTAK